VPIDEGSDPGELTIAVLTGLRPALLFRTLEAFEERQPDVWHAATRTVVHNTGDRATAEVLDLYEWDDRLELTGPLLPIAQASQHLIAQAALADRAFVLRLEDDWEVDRTPFWDEAVNLLGDARQVRLRKAAEPVMTRHRITKDPIRWRETEDGHLWAPSAHYTHNPSLMRTWDLVALSGYSDEIDAARRYHDAGWSTAQHVPGAFRHLGDRSENLSLKWSGGAA